MAAVPSSDGGDDLITAHHTRSVYSIHSLEVMSLPPVHVLFLVKISCADSNKEDVDGFLKSQLLYLYDSDQNRFKRVDFSTCLEELIF